METAETSGKTVDDAVARALDQLDRRRDQVDVEVVQEARSGFLGIGSGEAIVRVTVREAPVATPTPAASGSADGSEDGEGDEDGEDRPRRRRRGRRGGRGRRGRRDDAGDQDSQNTRSDDGGDARDEDAPPLNDRDDDDDDDDDLDDDEPPRRDEFEGRDRGGRGGGRREGGGRGRSGGRDDSRGGGRDGGRGRSGGRDDRDRRPIEAVAEDEEVRIPGAPPNLPEAINSTPEDDVDLFGSTLRDLLVLLGLGDTSITARDPETPGDGVGLINQVFDVYGDNDEASDELAVVIGRRGETLNSLQYLLNVLVSRHGSTKDVFGVDIEGYRRRREDTLVDMALEIAAEVRATGDVITLEPMPAAERRIIHLALETEQGIKTESVGRGEDRQVEVLPD